MAGHTPGGHQPGGHYPAGHQPGAGGGTSPSSSRTDRLMVYEYVEPAMVYTYTAADMVYENEGSS